MLGEMQSRMMHHDKCQGVAPFVSPATMYSLGTRLASSKMSRTSWKKVPILSVKLLSVRLHGERVDMRGEISR